MGNFSHPQREPDFSTNSGNDVFDRILPPSDTRERIDAEIEFIKNTLNDLSNEECVEYFGLTRQQIIQEKIVPPDTIVDPEIPEQEAYFEYLLDTMDEDDALKVPLGTDSAHRMVEIILALGDSSLIEDIFQDSAINSPPQQYFVARMLQEMYGISPNSNRLYFDGDADKYRDVFMFFARNLYINANNQVYLDWVRRNAQDLREEEDFYDDTQSKERLAYENERKTPGFLQRQKEAAKTFIKEKAKMALWFTARVAAGTLIIGAIGIGAGYGVAAQYIPDLSFEDYLSIIEDIPEIIANDEIRSIAIQTARGVQAAEDTQFSEESLEDIEGIIGVPPQAPEPIEAHPSELAPNPGTIAPTPTINAEVMGLEEAETTTNTFEYLQTSIVNGLISYRNQYIASGRREAAVINTIERMIEEYRDKESITFAVVITDRTDYYRNLQEEGGPLDRAYFREKQEHIGNSDGVVLFTFSRTGTEITILPRDLPMPYMMPQSDGSFTLGDMTKMSDLGGPITYSNGNYIYNEDGSLETGLTGGRATELFSRINGTSIDLVTIASLGRANVLAEAFLPNPVEITLTEGFTTAQVTIEPDVPYPVSGDDLLFLIRQRQGIHADASLDSTNRGIVFLNRLLDNPDNITEILTGIQLQPALQNVFTEDLSDDVRTLTIDGDATQQILYIVLGQIIESNPDFGSGLVATIGRAYLDGNLRVRAIQMPPLGMTGSQALEYYRNQ
ncbi:MAG: hypothetical protein QY314_01650 [Candidatus Dojkabacteria bacterium]|nr:MAG: hypothetical protein QY314_01650 [Candidatus Dojkabacteria bacterium]